MTHLSACRDRSLSAKSIVELAIQTRGSTLLVLTPFDTRPFLAVGLFAPSRFRSSPAAFARHYSCLRLITRHQRPRQHPLFAAILALSPCLFRLLARRTTGDSPRSPHTPDVPTRSKRDTWATVSGPMSSAQAADARRAACVARRRSRS